MGYNYGLPIRALLLMTTIAGHSRASGNSWPGFDCLQNIGVGGLETFQNNVPCRAVFWCLQLNAHENNPVSLSLKDFVVS